jgi:PAS domain S-box-containing protein
MPPSLHPHLPPALQSLILRIGDWQPDRLPVWQRYLAALLITAGAAWAGMSLAPVEAGGRFIIMSLAVALAALYGGFRAGMLSALVSMLLVHTLMTRPGAGLPSEDAGAVFGFNLWFLITQVVVVGAIALMQHQNARLRHLQQQNRRSQQQLQDTFEHSATSMAHCEISGRWIRINQTFCDLLGHTHAEMMALSFRDITHPDDLAADLALLQRLLAGEMAHYQLEKRYLHRKGHAVWVLLTVTLVRKPDGGPDYLIAVVQDITARRKTEEALRTSEQLLLQAQTLAGLATLRIDVATRRFFLLHGSREVLGQAVEEMDDTEMLARTHPQDRPPVMQAWANAVRGLGPFSVDYRVTFDGRERWYAVRAELQRNAQGRAVRGLGVVQDITARKSAELEIQRLNATLERRIHERTQALLDAGTALDRYACAIAQDLRAPLRRIGASAEALRAAGPRDGALAELERIAQASQLMGTRLDELLQLAQRTQGAPRRTPVDLTATAQGLMEALEAQEAAPVLRWSVQEGLHAGADPELVETLLHELLQRAWALAAPAPDARLRVYARQQGDQTWFCVSANGDGFSGMLPDPCAAPVPLPALQVDEAPAMGLAVVVRIVQFHGGVLLTQGTPGEGITWAFTLAAGTDAEPAPA